MKDTDKFELQIVLLSIGFLKDSPKETLKCIRKGDSNGVVIESQAYTDMAQAGCLSVLRKTLYTDLRTS